MSQPTFNSALYGAPGYWHPFMFLTELKEQMVETSSAKLVPTYISYILHEQKIKFFRMTRSLLPKVREICPDGNIADFLWRVRAIRKNQTVFFSYEIEGSPSSFDFFSGLDKEDLINEARIMLERIQNIPPIPIQPKYPPDVIWNTAQPTPAKPKFGRVIIVD